MEGQLADSLDAVTDDEDVTSPTRAHQDAVLELAVILHAHALPDLQVAVGDVVGAAAD